MKVVFLCTYYPQYLTAFYEKNPDLINKSYDEQLEAIWKDYFGVYLSYVEHFKKIGVFASLIIPNCKPLQKAWARENNVSFDSNWEFKIPIEQVRKSKPDIFYISSMFEYYGTFLDEVKKYAKNIFGWISCEIPRDINLGQLQLIFTSVPYYVDYFRNQRINSEFIHAAFNPSILELLEPSAQPDIDFSFIGSLSPAHSNRIKLIKALMDNTELQFFGLGAKNIPDDRGFISRLFSKSKYEKNIKGEVWGIDMFKTLKRSKITFNSHIDVSREYIGNMRMYEATGVGTLLLSDGKNAPMKNFNEDEVVYYESLNDVIDKVNYYLKNENERVAIAKKGQQRTLRDYNYEKSTRLMHEYFLQYMKG